MSRCVYLLAVLLFGISTTLTFASDKPKWGKISDAEWATPLPEDYPDANVIILFDIGEVEVEIDGISFYRHVRMKVFNDAGAEEVGDIAIWYWDGDKIKDLKAHTITPDGKKHKVEGGNIQKQEYEDRRTRTFSFPHVEPGSILEYKYRNFNKRFSSLDSWEFHNQQYTLSSQFSLTLAPGFIYSSAYNNIPLPFQEPTEEINVLDQYKTFTWEITNLPPLRDEPMSGAIYNFESSLKNQLVSYTSAYQYVAFVEGWQDLGEFFTDKFTKKFIRKNKGLKKLVTSLTADAADEDSKALALYNFVRDSIRTTKADGNDWLFPDNVEKTLQTREGNERGKNVLLVAMCREAGFQSWPVLITTSDYGVFSPKLYQLSQFNHIIAIINYSDGGAIVDASSQFCPFGVLPPTRLVSGGFLLDGKQSRIITIKPSAPSSYRLDNHYVTIDDSGLVHCSTTITLSGYFTDRYGNQIETTEEKDFIEDVLLADLDVEFDLIDYGIEQKREAQVIEVYVTYTSKGLVETLDGNLFFTQPTLVLNSNPFVDEKRFFPIDFQFPCTYHTKTSYTIPSKYSPADMPKDINSKTSILNFYRVSFVDSFNVTIESRLVISSTLVGPIYYKGIRRIFEEIEQANKEQIVFAPVENE